MFLMIVFLSLSLVQAILIMGEEWMGRVNDSLDDLEKEIQSIEIPEGDLEALREEESRHSVNPILAINMLARTKRNKKRSRNAGYW